MTGRWFAYAGTSSINIWDLQQTPEAISLDKHEGGVPGFAFSPDGNSIASVGKDSRCIVSSVEDGRHIQEIESGYSGPLQTVAYHPNGKVLALGSWRDGVTLWDVGSGRKLATPLAATEIWRQLSVPMGNCSLLVEEVEFGCGG